MINEILDFPKERRKTFFFCLFFLALAIRLCAIFFYTLFPTPKAGINADYEYGIIARAIADGIGYSMSIAKPDNSHISQSIINYWPTANQTPFFPYFLSFFYSFSEGPIAFFLIRIIHAVFSALTCIIMYLITLRLIHYKGAFVLGILCSFYPLFVSIMVRIVPETFFTFWISLTILFLFFLKDDPSLRNIAITGLLMGITLLNSNVITPFLPFIGIWLFLNLKGVLHNKLLKICLVFSIAILVIAPWLVRNYLVFNKFPLLKSTAGLNLWLGNNPSSSGTFFSKGGEDLFDVITKKFPEGFKLSEVEQDAIFYREAIDYIKANPFNYLKLVIKRFYYFWWFPPDEFATGSTTSYKKLMTVPYTVILILCIMGIFNIMRENWRGCLLIIALMLSISLMYSLFVVGHLRYRVPVEPYVLLFASQAIFLFVQQFVKICTSHEKIKTRHDFKK